MIIIKNVSSQQQVRPIYEDNADCVLLYACGWQEYSSLPRFQMILISVRFEWEPSSLPSSFNIKFATNLPQHGHSQYPSNAHNHDDHDDQHDDLPPPQQLAHQVQLRWRRCCWMLQWRWRCWWLWGMRVLGILIIVILIIVIVVVILIVNVTCLLGIVIIIICLRCWWLWGVRVLGILIIVIVIIVIVVVIVIVNVTSLLGIVIQR